MQTLSSQPADLSAPPSEPAGVVALPAIASGATAELDVALRALMVRGTPALQALVEHRLIHIAYDQCNRNQVRTARLLGISRNVLRAQLIRFGYLLQIGERRATRPPAGDDAVAHVTPIGRAEHAVEATPGL